LAHDGDNYGGGTDSYYQGNFDSFVSWEQGNSNFECSTVMDYLQRFPVPDEEQIHVEDGSWSGANNGDPFFLKWDPYFFDPAYEPERNSWAVLVAGVNRILTAQSIAPYQSIDNILSGNGSLTEQALHFLLCGQASDYEYWPTVEVWNSDPTRAVNLALPFANQVITSGTDNVPPTIFVPQRQYWNPGAYDWNPNLRNPSDFGIWTAIYDVSGVSTANLMIRVTSNTTTPSNENLLYAGGQWTTISLDAYSLNGSSQTDPLPMYIADLYKANVTGVTNSLVDYYVEAVDSLGNVAKSPIQHVFVA